MPNPIKYTTGSESDALIKGNFRIGTGAVGKGPSDSTGYYQGPSPVSGGYVIYMNKDGAPGNLSYHSAANDAQLISFTNSLAGQSYTTVQQCFDYYYGQTDKVLVNQDYPDDYPYIVMDGLVLNLDAGITQSYPGSGTVWTDVNGLGPKNNGTLTNGPTFSSNDGGGIVFDGVDDNINLGDKSSLNISSSNLTLEGWVYRSSSANYMVPITRRSPSGLQYQLTWTTSNENYLSGLFRNNIRLDLTISGNIVSFNSNSAFTSINTWAYIVGTYDGSNVKIYYNGDLINTISENRNITTFNVNNYVGYDGTSSFTNGRIAISRIYNRALTATEVLQNYNATKGRFGL
jgi:hypothetical protein